MSTVVLRRALAAAGLLAAAVPARLAAQTLAPPADSVRAPVLAAVQGVLDAIASRDTAAARRWTEPGAVLFALPPNAAGTPRRQSDSAFIAFLGGGTGGRFLERIWAPEVRVRGGLALVWAPYDFHVDGRRTHCGVDTFTVVRGPAGWRVASIAYTVEQTGCVASPLGEP